MGRTCAALLATALLIACAAPAQAPAAPGWVSPDDLSLPGRNATEPKVAIDPSGNAVAVWTRSNGLNTIVQGSSRPAGGVWSQPADLSVAGRNAKEPQIGIDAAGNATAVWTRSNGSHDIIQASSRPAGGAWSPPQDLSAKERNAREPQIAVSLNGWAVAIWSRFDGADFIVQASYRPRGGAWGQPDGVSEVGEQADEPQVAIDSAGSATAVWSRFDGSDRIIQSSSRPPGGGWSEPADLSEEGGSADEPQLDVGDSGSAIAVWSRGPVGNRTAQSASRLPGGAWQPPLDASDPGESATEPQVALGGGDNAIAVWRRTDIGPYTIVQAADGPAGAEWLPPQDLTSSGNSIEDPQVDLGPQGSAIAVWARSSGAPTVVEGRIRPAGGAWQAPVSVSVIGSTAAEPDLATGPTGDGVTAWARDDDVNTIAQAAGFDGAGPLVGGLSVPAAGTITQPLRFSVAPFDVWSPINTIGWNFGDGGGAQGAVVEHAYASAGTYPVAAAAADAFGNGGSAAAMVTIYRKPAAGRNVRVRRKRALLRLRCPSPAGFSGVLRLVAAIEAERRGRVIRSRRTIGRVHFSIPGGRSTVPVRLTRPGLRAVRGAGRRGLRTQLTGPGVRHRLVVLFGARKHSAGKHRRHQ